VFATDAKESLLRIAENGDLVDLMSVLPKTPVETKLVVSVPNKSPTVVATSGKNFFVGPKWTSRVGTEFLFFDNKTGTMTKAERTVPFKWSKKDGMIQVEAETTYYFKFQESGDSFFGVRLNDITQFVKPESGKGQGK